MTVRSNLEVFLSSFSHFRGVRYLGPESHSSMRWKGGRDVSLEKSRGFSQADISG